LEVSVKQPKMQAKIIQLIRKNIEVQINYRKVFSLVLQDLDQVIEQLETKLFRINKKCLLIKDQEFIHHKFYQALFRELIKIVFSKIIKIVHGELVLISKYLKTLM
jgi:hypothetical protein